MQAEVWPVPSPELSMCVSGTEGPAGGDSGESSQEGVGAEALFVMVGTGFMQRPQDEGAVSIVICIDGEGGGEWWVGDRWVSKGWMGGQ